jgi:hypothetical protein
MLGELIEETTGKRTSRKVLSTNPLKVEVSFEGAGKLLGIDAREIVTYESAVRPDGSFYGEGRGVYLAGAGDAVSWEGAGVGKLAADGTATYRGAVYFWTTSEKFARLNSVAGVFEFQADAEGNTHSKTWEWK